MLELVIKESCSGFWKCLTPGEYIQSIAVFIAMIAAIASWFAIYTQKRINKKNQEAIIVPGIKNVEAKIMNVLSDWDTYGKVPKKFSNTTLPLWNYGNTPVFNIGYCYYIENIDELLDEEKMEFDHKINHTVNVMENRDREEHQEKYYLDVRYKNIAEQSGSQTRKIVPYIRNIDVIKPKENTEIKLPDYFIILLNDYFLHTPFKYKQQPILKLKVFFDDVNFQTWEQQFLIFIPQSYNFSKDDLITSLQYEVKQKKKKRKRLTIRGNEKRLRKK